MQNEFPPSCGIHRPLAAAFPRNSPRCVDIGLPHSRLAIQQERPHSVAVQVGQLMNRRFQQSGQASCFACSHKGPFFFTHHACPSRINRLFPNILILARIATKKCVKCWIHKTLFSVFIQFGKHKMTDPLISSNILKRWNASIFKSKHAGRRYQPEFWKETERPMSFVLYSCTCFLPTQFHRTIRVQKK